ncbi:general secretion pathway protein GspJ [Aliidongia dinghuensis]|uniref:General secretion pathway protein GspJ n=1 Tax=Aliidongia dinghuensis TaxID=1867774 RepID=A0A8J3E5N2_9PROT|nr:prepilin-type N-terminal cleavage/methylation domain-containing protein [Aliidongia dinghuensis]GGF36530.1 general secretion pathway protein GspJ [Aliidongia dinghuensis]
MTARQSSEGTAGFTLLELLVVLAIFGLMSVLLSGGLRTIGHLVAGGTDRLDRASGLALTSNFLERVLADARPLPTGDGEDAVAFDGTANGLRFVGPPPVYLAPGAFHAERLGVEDEGGRHRLVFRAGALGDARQSRSVLLDGVGAARFAYFGADVGAGRPGWHDRWPGAWGLPALVRLRITFADGSSAPDLVVAPRPAEAGFQ